jgi:hypothetical protein
LIATWKLKLSVTTHCELWNLTLAIEVKRQHVGYKIMAFQFTWPIFNAEFGRDLAHSVTAALNKNPNDKPTNIVSDIIVTDLNFGSQGPYVEMLELVDFTSSKLRAIFRIKYDGDASISIQAQVQVNPLVEEDTSIVGVQTFPISPIVAAATPFVVPIQMKISRFLINGIVSLTIDRKKGVTVDFKNDPLESVSVSSSFDHVPSISKFLQAEIEGILRKVIKQDLPALLHTISVQSEGKSFVLQRNSPVNLNDSSQVFPTNGGSILNPEIIPDHLPPFSSKNIFLTNYEEEQNEIESETLAHIARKISKNPASTVDLGGAPGSIPLKINKRFEMLQSRSKEVIAVEIAGLSQLVQVEHSFVKVVEAPGSSNAHEKPAIIKARSFYRSPTLNFDAKNQFVAKSSCVLHRSFSDQCFRRGILASEMPKLYRGSSLMTSPLEFPFIQKNDPHITRNLVLAPSSKLDCVAKLPWNTKHSRSNSIPHEFQSPSFSPNLPGHGSFIFGKQAQYPKSAVEPVSPQPFPNSVKVQIANLHRVNQSISPFSRDIKHMTFRSIPTVHRRITSCPNSTLFLENSVQESCDAAEFTSTSGRIELSPTSEKGLKRTWRTATRRRCFVFDVSELKLFSI